MNECPLTSSIREFLGYWAGYGILCFRPCWCPLPFLRLSYLSVFPFTFLRLFLDFIRVSSLRPTYLRTFGQPLTYSLFRSGGNYLSTLSSQKLFLHGKAALAMIRIRLDTKEEPLK